MHVHRRLRRHARRRSPGQSKLIDDNSERGPIKCIGTLYFLRQRDPPPPRLRGVGFSGTCAARAYPVPVESRYALLQFEWRMSPACAGASLIGKPVSTLAFARACFSRTCARSPACRHAEQGTGSCRTDQSCFRRKPSPEARWAPCANGASCRAAR